jgi:hypothetical protein
MNLDQFDQQIKNKIADFEVPYEPSTWDLLAQKMDTVPVAETTESSEPAWEDTMRNRLQSVEVPFQPMHWGMLAQRMDQLHWVQQLRRNKLIESALIVLIVLNFQAVWRSTHAIIDWAIPPAETVPVTPPKAKLPIAKAGNKGATDRNSDKANQALALLPLPSTSLPYYNGDLPKIEILDGLVTTSQVPGSIGANMIHHNGQPVSMSHPPLSLLAALLVEPLSFNRQPQPLASIQVPESKIRKKSNGNYIAAFAQGTRATLTDPNTAYRTQADWVGAGLTIGKSKGKWGIETGFSLHQGGIVPEKDIFAIEKINGQHVGIAIAKVNTQVLNVPAKVTREIIRSGRTSVHATVSATAMAALNKSYQFSETILPSVPNQSGDAVPRPAADGWAEGGSLNENFALSADLGLRVAHRVNRKVSAFVEPLYQRQLAGKGFGPTALNRQGFAVQAGVLAQL